MSNAELSPRIRSMIARAATPPSIGDLSKALDVPRHMVSNACFNMTRTGVLVRHGLPNHTQRFTIGRPLQKSGVKVDPAKEAERLARKAERARLSDERAQWAANKLKLKKAREMKAAKKLQPHLAALAKSAEKRTPTPPVRKTRVAQTSEEFIKAGGRIEHVPQGAVAEPLRFIGHRATNEMDWRKSR